MLTSALRKVSPRFLSLISAAAITIMSGSVVTGPQGYSEAQAGQRSGGVRSNRSFVNRRNYINRYNNRLVFQNHLQSQRRAGAVLANPRRVGISNVIIANPSYGHRHSGVYLHGNRRDRLFNQRRRDISRRNDRLVIENHLQSVRRSNSVLANPRHRGFGDTYVYGGNGGYASDGGHIGGGAGFVASQECPSKYNCGYRIYSDGTGPRIITPGIAPGNGLPEYDGISGPKVISIYD